MSLIKNKGFTLIELLVTIAVLGILVLLGIPRFTSYVQEAQLTRIQHDVRVMEQEMVNVLAADNNFNEWQNNGKDLGRVIMRKELYENQGIAKNLDWEHLSDKWLQADKGGNQLTNKNNELGMGGDLIELDNKYSTYKIIPKEYTSKINTRLKGTFYANSSGKVYYEHDKSLGKAIEKDVLACDAPSTLGYDFEVTSGSGTITGWNGNATHVVIPSAFKMSEGGEEWCEPVRAIGAGAFQNGTFKRVTIPQSVEETQDEAFQGGELIEIEVPHSVKVVGDNAFTDNPATSSGGDSGSGGSGGSSDGSGGADGSKVIIKGSSSGRTISDSAFGGLTPNYSPVTDKDLGVITKTKNSGGKTLSIIGKTVASGSSSNNSNTVINIPKELEINGEILPVTEIEKGAFQGSGLIDVIMPEGLLYIHDYAFAGNQLVRAVIPNSVIEVGNYAFAYNEIASKPTIDPINILESKFSGNFGHVDSEGNISQPDNTIDLKDHIFIISSMGNHVIEDIGANPGQTGIPVNPENPTEPEEEPGYSDEEIWDLITEGYIPISTAAELNDIRNNDGLGKKYVQVANIDLSGYSEGGWNPIGTYSSGFTGTYDGGNYVITGLKVKGAGKDYQGLFGYTDRATISNVALENINVTGKVSVGGLVGWANTNTTIRNSYATGSVTGTIQVGGLMGAATSNTTIRNSYATGSVTGEDNVGGLVGYSYSSTIENSYATGSVKGLNGNVGGLVGLANSRTTISNSYSTGSVTGASDHIGGLVGWIGNGTKISNSYSTGSVTGTNEVGGLVGEAYEGTNTKGTNISNSYATGSVTGRNQVGGLVGVAGSITISNSYWDKDTTGRSWSAGGIRRATEDMMKEKSYSGWDFESVWKIDEGNDYPKLR